DLVSETIDLDGIRATLVDTAGLRETDDRVESEGVRRTRGAAEIADLVLLVADGSQPLNGDMSSVNIDTKRLIVASKADLPAAWTRDDAVAVSSLTGQGLDTLRRRIVSALDVELVAERPAIT